MHRISIFCLVLMACSESPGERDDHAPDAMATVTPDAVLVDAPPMPPAQFMSMTVGGVALSTDSALAYQGGSYLVAIVGRFANGDSVSLHLDGDVGTVACELGTTAMSYIPVHSTTEFAADGTDGTACSITIATKVPTRDGWFTGSFSGTLERGAETVVIEGGAFAAYWP